MSGSEWPEPPASAQTFEGRPRRVGVEVEFGGLEPAGAAEIVVDAFGGEVEQRSEYEYLVRDTRHGDFRIEVDHRLIKRLGREVADGDLGSLDLKRLTTDVLGAVASAVVPVEIVTPPIPWSSLHELDGMVEPLREAGALGTSHSAFYAFGVHLNPEIPDAEPATIVAHLQAFLCLHDWLQRSEQVDPVRRLSPFIKRFPGAYEELVLADGYRPDLATLIDDYLEHNATRNRALDLLPLLAWLDGDAVRERLPDEKNNPRPTFHYRLPNCELHRPDWSLAAPWRDWLQVEYLAADPPRLAEIRQARRADRKRLTSGLDDTWIHHCEAWLIDL